MHWNWAMARRFSDFYKQGVFFQHFCSLLLFPVLFRLVDALYTTGFRRINECCHCDSTFGACRILKSRKVFWKPGILQSTAIQLVCNPFAIQNGAPSEFSTRNAQRARHNAQYNVMRNAWLGRRARFETHEPLYCWQLFSTTPVGCATH